MSHPLSWFDCGSALGVMSASQQERIIEPDLFACAVKTGEWVRQSMSKYHGGNLNLPWNGGGGDGEPSLIPAWRHCWLLSVRGGLRFTCVTSCVAKGFESAPSQLDRSDVLLFGCTIISCERTNEQPTSRHDRWWSSTRDRRYTQRQRTQHENGRERAYHRAKETAKPPLP